MTQTAAEHSMAEWIYTGSQSDRAPYRSAPLCLLCTHPFSLSVFVRSLGNTWFSLPQPHHRRLAAVSKDERVTGSKEQQQRREYQTP